MNQTKKLLLFFLSIGLFWSCSEDDLESNSSNELEYLEPLTINSNKELKEDGLPLLKEAIIDLHNIMEVILRKPDVADELFILGNTDYYNDHYIGLKDLLSPEKSRLYAVANIEPSMIGSFKREFEQELDKQKEMLNLKKYVSNIELFESNNVNELNLDLFIYCPYCTEVDSPSEPIVIPTLVEAADEAIGNKLLADGSMAGVLVNDEVAAENLSYIVTSLPNDDAFPPQLDLCCPDDDLPGGITPNPPSVTPVPAFDCIDDNINRVYFGDMIVHEQLDPFIGFINSGGSEMRAMRINGYLQLADGHVIREASEHFTTHFYKRKWIRKGYWVRWTSLWHSDWDCDDTEQVLAIYEEDNNVDLKVSGSFSTQLTVPGVVDSLVNASINYDVTIHSDDDLVEQWRMVGDTFFRTNDKSQGCLRGTDSNENVTGLRVHNNFNNESFAVYCGGGAVTYTMPHQIFD